MQARLIDQNKDRKTFVVVFDKNDEFASGLKAFAEEKGLTASHFTAIGAFKNVTLGFFDREIKDYAEIPIDEQVEVLSLMGNITLKEKDPQIHAHTVLGKADGTAYGGHLLKAYVWPTLEVIVVESPTHLQRQTDDETGLPLIDLRLKQAIQL